MRAGIAAIPDGTYRFSDFFDDNQFPEQNMELSVAITVKGDEMHLDFDAPPQVPAGLNVIFTALLATCYYAVKAVIDPTILPNAGLSRPIKVTAPHGSILNCRHPAAVDGRIAACQRVADIVQGALAQALPDRVTAAGNGCCTGADWPPGVVPGGRSGAAEPIRSSILGGAGAGSRLAGAEVPRSA
jgi:N-methylhydantoinase B